MDKLAETMPASRDDVLADITERAMGLAKGILVDQSRDHGFAAETALADVGLSSLDLVNLMISIEAEFDIMIPPRQLNPKNFNSIASIASMILTLKS